MDKQLHFVFKEKCSPRLISTLRESLTRDRVGMDDELMAYISYASHANIERLKRVVVISKGYARSEREHELIQEFEQLVDIIDRDNKNETNIPVGMHEFILERIKVLLTIPSLTKANCQSWEELVRNGKAERL